jgi:hypothetical protein
MVEKTGIEASVGLNTGFVDMPGVLLATYAADIDE